MIIAAVLALAGFAALSLLQVHLSRKKSPVPGLILPVVSGLLTLFVALPIALFALRSEAGTVLVGNRVGWGWEEPRDSLPASPEKPPHGDEPLAGQEPGNPAAAVAYSAVLLIPLMFIPTLTFTVIYIVFRVLLRRSPPETPREDGYASPAELNKMNIQDL